jgi:hypothetical protein
LDEQRAESRLPPVIHEKKSTSQQAAWHMCEGRERSEGTDRFCHECLTWVLAGPFTFCGPTGTGGDRRGRGPPGAGTWPSVRALSPPPLW